jgi:hypothetical protein
MRIQQLHARRVIVTQAQKILEHFLFSLSQMLYSGSMALLPTAFFSAIFRLIWQRLLSNQPIRRHCAPPGQQSTLSTLK